MTSIDSISCDLEFELDGKKFGNLEFSFSDNKHAFGMSGVKNVMQHMGMITSQPESQTKTRFLNGVDGSYYLSAPFSGIFEPYRELGEQVVVGDIASQLYSTEEVERDPLELKFSAAGTLMVRRNGARVRRGSHLFMVAAEMEREDVLAIY
jgi:predicted deacylase